MIEAFFLALAGLFGYVLKGLYERSRLEFDPSLIVEQGEYWTQYFAKVRNTGRSSSTRTYGLVTIRDLGEENALDKASIIWAREVHLSKRKLGTRRRKESYLLTKENFCPVVDELLCWSRFKAPTAIDIPSTGASNLVLFRHFRPPAGSSKPSQIQVPSEDGWTTLRVAFSDEETKMLEVRVVNDAGVSARAVVNIAPSENAEDGLEVQLATDC